MTETLIKPNHNTEREILQDRLAAIDRDPVRLQGFIADLYHSAPENPHILYAAANHLISLTYLEHRDPSGRIVLPAPDEAGRAFAMQCQLLGMLQAERDAPLYLHNERVRRRLIGTREELAFHAGLTYALSQGGDFVALPTPAGVDFAGGEESSDVQIFFAGADQPDLEIQVKFQSNGNVYHPRIPILNLETALGGKEQASQLRGILREIGETTNGSSTPQLAPREHNIVLDSSAAIMKATYDWGGAEAK